MSDDEALLTQAVTGDSAALATLLERHGPEVRAQLRIDPKWTSVVDADDVMQVTYLEAFLQFGRFKPQGIPAFVGWLRRIAENNLRDAVKEMERAKRPPPDRRVSPSSYDESVSAFIGLLGVTMTTPSVVATRQESSRSFEQALSALPPDYATVIRLYDLEGRGITEVAQQMGRSAGAVHMLRTRAHEHLRELLAQDSRFFSRGA
jgi:RNA polymerase sigma-70 factor (ECF subfamily)